MAAGRFSDELDTPPRIQDLESGCRTACSKPLSHHAPALVGALIGLVLAGLVGEYRFRSGIWGDGGFPIAPVADEAERWDAVRGGSGDTLCWEVSRDEDWDILFEWVDGVLPEVERAMASWSGIPMADISWTLDGVGEAEPRVSQDSVNTLFIDADAGFGGFAGIPQTGNLTVASNRRSSDLSNPAVRPKVAGHEISTGNPVGHTPYAPFPLGASRAGTVWRLRG